jgi:hypothetical protein
VSGTIRITIIAAAKVDRMPSRNSIILQSP